MHGFKVEGILIQPLKLCKEEIFFRAINLPYVMLLQPALLFLVHGNIQDDMR